MVGRMWEGREGGMNGGKDVGRKGVRYEWWEGCGKKGVGMVGGMLEERG